MLFLLGPGTGFGGALYSQGTATLRANTFLGNKAVGGAGFVDGIAFHVKAGSAGEGGAIYSTAILSMVNTTIVSNSVVGGVGKADQGSLRWWASDGGDAIGAGLCSLGQTFVTNCTFAWNKAKAGTGGKPLDPEIPDGQDGTASGGAIASLSGSVFLQNTLLSESVGAANVFGAVSDGGHNLSTDSSPGWTNSSSLTSTSSRLVQFANHGGPTPTIALLGDSPAVDNGAVVPDLVVDQRGFRRPVGAAADIGAYELQPQDILDLTTGSASPGSFFSITFHTVPGVTYVIEATEDLLNGPWSSIREANGSGELEQVTDNPTGTARFFRIRMSMP